MTVNAHASLSVAPVKHDIMILIATTRLNNSPPEHLPLHRFYGPQAHRPNGRAQHAAQGQRFVTLGK